MKKKKRITRRRPAWWVFCRRQLFHLAIGGVMVIVMSAVVMLFNGLLDQLFPRGPSATGSCVVFLLFSWALGWSVTEWE